MIMPTNQPASTLGEVTPHTPATGTTGGTGATGETTPHTSTTAKPATPVQFANQSSIEPAATMVLRLGYQGEQFAGYAFQEGQRTVEGCLRDVLQRVLRRDVTLTCAGRTDAGVHAHAQYVSFPVTHEECARDKSSLLRSLNMLCPADIAIRTIYQAAPDFSARFDARSRSYTYRIAPAPLKPVLTASFVWWNRHVHHVCMDDMNAAAQALIGEHNFESFCKATSADVLKSQGLSLQRCITSINVHRDYVLGEQLICIDIEGNAFLHNMVRIIAGSLLEVGRGARSVSWLGDVLAARTRTAAAQTAPACGLTLEHVAYPAQTLTPWHE